MDAIKSYRRRSWGARGSIGERLRATTEGAISDRQRVALKSTAPSRHHLRDRRRTRSVGCATWLRPTKYAKMARHHDLRRWHAVHQGLNHDPKKSWYKLRDNPRTPLRRLRYFISRRFQQ